MCVSVLLFRLNFDIRSQIRMHLSVCSLFVFYSLFFFLSFATFFCALAQRIHTLSPRCEHVFVNCDYNIGPPTKALNFKSKSYVSLSAVLLLFIPYVWVFFQFFFSRSRLPFLLLCTFFFFHFCIFLLRVTL